MANKRQREVTLALAAVVVLVGVVLAYRVRTMTPDGSVADQPTHGVAAAGQPPASGQGLTELNLPALTTGHGELQDTVRDPFRFKPKPPPPPVTVGGQPVTPVMEPTGPVEPPPPPRIPLKFFGTFESKDKGLGAALSDGGKVYYGHVGDTVEGRYRILRIGVESIELAYLDGRGKQTIRFTGQ